MPGSRTKIAPPEASENRLLPGYGSGRGTSFPFVVEFDAVQDDETAAAIGVAGHEGFGEEVEAGAIDDHAGFADGIDERPAGRVAEHIDHAALGAIQERLAHVAVDDHFPLFDDLAQLVLGVAMHGDGQAVNAGTQIIAAAAVNFDGHIGGFRAEAAADVSLADAIEADEMPPAFHERVHQQLRVAVAAFRRKIRGVNGQRGFAFLRRTQIAARREINEPERALAGILGTDIGEAAEQPVQFRVDDMQNVAAFLGAGRVTPVVEQREGLDDRGGPGGIFCRINHLPASRRGIRRKSISEAGRASIQT